MEKEKKEYLSHFPQDLNNHLKDIYPKLCQSIDIKDIVEVKRYTIIFYQVLLDMFVFAWEDDGLIMDVGMFWTWYFLGYDFEWEIDLWLWVLQDEIGYLFMHELDLPPHHTSYKSYDEPKRLVIEKLQQAIKILQE